MSDEKESDSIGPDIDLEKIAGEDDESTGHGADAEAHGHDAHGEETHGHDAHDHDDEPAGRTTAPQSEFTTKQAMIGAVVTVVGIAIAYGVPALLG